jgi:hypothetical protein
MQYAAEKEFGLLKPKEKEQEKENISTKTRKK